ncbi:MAG: polysaccharide deacetylase family protein [Solibacillus sp.]
MSIHFVKLIELLSIDQVQDKKFLHIVVYADKAFESYWEVDLETAENLQRLCEFNGNHKYRLSLKAAINDSSSNPKITSHITKTYLNQSARTDFFTTEAYRQQVELIRQNGSAARLQQLPFLFTPEELIELKERATNDLFTIDEEHSFDDITFTVPNVNPPETIVITKEELVILKGPLIEDTLVATIPAEKVQQNSETKALVNIQEENARTKMSPLRLLLKKLLALFSILAIVVIGTYFLAERFTPMEKLLANKQSTYEAYEIEEPFIFKLPANHVALTFDKGPSIYTQEIMDILKNYEVGATFFILGSNVNTFPLTVERMHEEGYAIGHATANYSLLTDMPYDKIESEWLYTSQRIEAITGKRVELFRPPYGLFNKNTLAVANDYDFHLVTWSLDPLESKTTTIHNYLQANELSGAIISMTESQETIDALPTIVDTLLENKLKIVQLQ